MLLSQYCNQIFFSFTKVTPKSLMSFHSRLVSPIGLLFSKSIQTTPLVASLQNLNSKSSGDTFFWTYWRTCVKNLIPFALIFLVTIYNLIINPKIGSKLNLIPTFNHGKPKLKIKKFYYFVQFELVVLDHFIS